MQKSREHPCITCPSPQHRFLHPRIWLSVHSSFPKKIFLTVPSLAICVRRSKISYRSLFNFFPKTFSLSSKEKPDFPFKSPLLKFKFFLQAPFSCMHVNEFSYVFCHCIKDSFAHFWSHVPHLLLCLSKGLFYIHFPITLLFVIIGAHYLGWQVFSVTFSSIPS